MMEAENAAQDQDFKVRRRLEYILFFKITLLYYIPSSSYRQVVFLLHFEKSVQLTP